jgi:hypothetical protein
MKDVLTVYAQPYDPKRPTVCFDEKSLQLLAAGRPALPMKPGAPLRQDPDYVRQGTRNLFLFVEPKAGQRHTLVTRHRTKEDFAKVMRYLVDQIYPGVDLIDVVLDHLNTHTTQAVIEIFGQPEADRILQRVQFHYTPVHASWLNMAEIELSVATEQCLDRRIPDEWTLATELIAWEHSRNQQAKPFKWSFDWKCAKRKFLKTDRGLAKCR